MTEKIKDVWLYANSEASMEAATEAAVEVVRSHDSDLTILGFAESDHPMMREPSGRELLAIVEEHREQKLSSLRERVCRELPEDHVTVTRLDGEVAWHALTSHAVRKRPDLVIIPADGGATAGPYGTLSQHLFRKCPAPVWSVQATTHRVKRVLVAVDAGAKGSDQRTLSEEVLRVAKALAVGTAIEIHVADAWSLLGEHLIESRLGVRATVPFLETQKQYVQDFTVSLLEDTGGAESIAAVHYPKGEPGIAIPALALEIGADVVILGSSARRGLEGFLIGSVAETILSRLGCSALVVKRSGFISPVRVD